MRNMLELLKRREKLKNEQMRVLARLTAVQANVHFTGTHTQKKKENTHTSCKDRHF